MKVHFLQNAVKLVTYKMEHLRMFKKNVWHEIKYVFGHYRYTKIIP